MLRLALTAVFVASLGMATAEAQFSEPQITELKPANTSTKMSTGLNDLDPELRDPNLVLRSKVDCGEVVSPIVANIRCNLDDQLLQDWQVTSRPAEMSASSTADSRVDVKASTVETPHVSRPDFNRDIFYKNRLEFSLDGGWLPINIPFVFDVFLGDGYTMTPLRYTLVPIIASLRWQFTDVGGRWIFRGNWDLTASGTVTLIPRGPETRYFAWIMGLRRNFVPRRGRIAPYFDGRLGLGEIDAKEPLGVLYAQGQNFTFTVNMGSGVRYKFNSRYSMSAGLNWMHISNLYLSEPKFSNYGINVYGPMFGIDVRLGRPRHDGSE